MLRRDFVRTGVALGAVGLGDVNLAPRPTSATPVRPSDPLRLNSNENPLGLAPKARRAVIEGIAEANRYPGESEVRLIEALAANHGIAPEQIVLGAGSTEVLQMLVQATAIAGGTVLLPDPTFEDVEGYAEPFPTSLVKVSLDRRYAHDTGRMQEAAERAARPVLVYVCNPNNPTGTVTPCAEIDEWIAATEDATFLVDEAYFEYVEDSAYWSALKWIADRPNVVVVRTFSKIYGMAGMRLGYGMAHPETAARMRQFISHNNVNHLALVAGLASLSDGELIARGRATNREGARVLQEALDELSLEHLPSHTNFLMHRVPGELDTYIGRMREHGVKVGRPFPPMLSYNRLSIGTPAEMERFVEVLRAFRRKGWV